MKVELKEHWGVNLATGEKQQLAQYYVCVDGRAVGYVGHAPGSRVCLIKRLGPIERKEVEQQVAWLLEQPPMDSAQVPDVPEEVLKPKKEDASDDDFDS